MNKFGKALSKLVKKFTEVVKFSDAFYDNREKLESVVTHNKKSVHSLSEDKSSITIHSKPNKL